MNSKNLSKAINRMLAILLTAAMVAGSFTVPVKAVEGDAVNEETSEPVVENNATAGEETSEEAEESVMESITEEALEEADKESGTEAGDTRYLAVDEVAFAVAVPSVYNATAVAADDLTACFAVYSGGENPLKITADSAKIDFEIYYKEKEADAFTALAKICQTTPASTDYVDSNPSKSIKNAGIYRIDYSFRDASGDNDLDLRGSKEFTIDKVDLGDWTFTNSGTNNKSGQMEVTSTHTYTVAQVGSTPEYAAAPVKAADVAVTYAKPTSGDPTTLQTELETAFHDGGAVIDSTDADITFENGAAGAKSLYSATPTGTSDADKPKVVITLKDSIKNFKGTFKVPFTIGQKSDVSKLVPDATTTDIVVDIPSTGGCTGTIDLGTLLKDEIKDTSGNNLYINEEIKSVSVDLPEGGDEAAELCKFFAGIAGYLNDGETTATIPNIKIDGKTLTYVTKKGSEITNLPDGVTVDLIYTLNNYSTTKTVPVRFVASKNDATENTSIKYNDAEITDSTIVKVPYTGDVASFDIGIESTGVDFTDASNYQGITAYFYTGQGAGKKLAKTVPLSKDNFSEGASGGTIKYTVTAPTAETNDTFDFSEIGKYSVLIIYKGKEATSPAVTHTARQLINFDVVKNNGSLAISITPTANTVLKRNITTAGKLPLNPAGTEITKDDITVKIGDDELEYGTEYEIITTPNDAVSKTATKSKWSYANKLTELKGKDAYKTALADASGLDDVYTNAGGTYTGEFINIDGSLITAITGENTSESKKVFTDQPYAKIQLKEGNAHYGSATPVYIRYEIEDKAAVANDDFVKAYTVDIGSTGRNVPVKGAFTVNGVVEEPDYYTLTSSSSTGGSITATPGTNDRIDPNVGFTYASAAAAAGNTYTFTLTPHFASGITCNDDVTITVKCVGNVTISSEFGSTVKGKFNENNEMVYSGTAPLTASNSIITPSSTDFVVKVKSGNNEITNPASFTTTTLYKLAKETNNINPNEWDKIVYNGETYTRDGTSTASNGTDTDTEDAAISSGITCTDAGHYLIVTKINSGADYVAKEPAKLAFEIKKFALSDENLTLTLIHSGTPGKVAYKSAGWTSLMADTPALATIVTAVAAKDGAQLPSTISALLSGAHVTLNVGDLSENTNGKYEVPVSITCKPDDLVSDTVYVNNYSGTVNGKIEISNKQLVAADFKINIKSQKFEYTGSVQKPELLSISYKNQPYTGTQEEILAKLAKAIDEDYFVPTLIWPGDGSTSDATIGDGKSVGANHKLWLKVGGLYELDADTVFSSTYSITKAKSDDIKAPEAIDMKLPSDATSDGSAVKVGVLPLVFGSESSSSVEYKAAATPYDASPTISSTVVKNEKGEIVTSTPPSLTVTVTEGNILNVKPSVAASGILGYTFEFNIPAKFDNYADKNVPVKVTVAAAGLNTTTTLGTVTGLGFNGSYNFNGLNAEERLDLLAGAQKATVTQAGETFKFNDAQLRDGKLNIEWYGSATGANYEPCSLDDTKNVGYYKALVTLEDAKKGYYMTPVWTQVLQVTKTSPIAADKLAENIKVIENNYVYNGEAQEPELVITLKAGAIRAAANATFTTEAITASDEYTLVKGKDYTLTGDYTAAGTAKTITIADGNIDVSAISGNLTAANKNNTYKIAKKDVVIELSDATLPLKTTDTPAVTYDMVKGTVTGIVEDVDKLDEGKLVLKATDSDGKSVALADICKKAGKYTVEVDDEFAANTITNTAGNTDKTDNYKLDIKNSRPATITVAAPKELTNPTIEVYADGNKVSKNGRVKYTGSDIAIDVVVKDGADTLKKAVDYTFTPVTVKEAGDYTIKISSAGDMYSFADQEFKFTVKENATAEEEVTIKLYNTENVGEEYATHSVARGMSVDKAILDNYVNPDATVEGWYKDAAFRKQWKFDTDVFNDDVTSLYAKTFYVAGDSEVENDYITISMKDWYEYTGSKIVPTAVVKRVTNGVETVIRPSKKTYTVAYDTAVNACDDDKPYKATFTFYDDYKKLVGGDGTIVKPFVIVQSCITDNIKIAGNGTGLLLNAKYKPITSVKGSNGKTLKESEYKIKVYDPEGTEVATSNAKMTFDKEGTYKIEVTGDGVNYECDESEPWEIKIPVAAKAKHMKNAKVTIAAQKVTKADDFPVMPAISVKLPDGKTATIAKGETESTDGKVHVAYEYNDKVGKATAQIEADGFIGYINKTFQITANGTAVTAANIFTGGKETAKEIKALSKDYTGYGITLDKLAKDNKLGIEDLIKEEYVDSLLITYKNNIKAGTATMTIAGKPDSGLKGKFTQTFKINKVNFAEAFKEGMIEVYDFSAEENEGVIEITKAAFVKTNSRTGAITALNGPILYNAETRDFLTYKKDFTLVTKSGKTYLKGAGSYSLNKDALIEVKLGESK